jgi:hypothetical protein
MRFDDRLLVAILGTEHGVLPLQFVDALVSPATSHDGRIPGVLRDDASKRACSGTAFRIRQSER